MLLLNFFSKETSFAPKVLQRSRNIVCILVRSHFHTSMTDLHAILLGKILAFFYLAWKFTKHEISKLTWMHSYYPHC
jgi:hypothetical protein